VTAALIRSILSLNQTIIEQLKDIDCNPEYVVNTTLVAKQRVSIIYAAMLQMDKNPAMVDKAEKMILSEIDRSKSLQNLIEEARMELSKIDKKTS